MRIRTTIGSVSRKLAQSLLVCLILPAGSVLAQTLGQPESYLDVQGAPAGSQNFLHNLSLSSGGAKSSSTPGTTSALQVGYASVNFSGSAPYGTAVFSFVQNGIVVSEVGVPASPPTTRARIFIDYRFGRPQSVDVNTGFAVANSGTVAANVTYTLRDLAGGILATGHGTIGPGRHRAKFIDQLSAIDQLGVALAPDFIFPGDFAAKTQFASLEIAGDQKLSVVALRMTTNQRNEVLFTSTPIADLNQATGNSALYFPQFVDGGGYTTTVILLNTSNTSESGTLRILDDKGNPLTVKAVGGAAGSMFPYQMPPGGGYVLLTDGSPLAYNMGWVTVTPDLGTSTPVGAGVFSFTKLGNLITEAGIPSSALVKHAHVYIDTSGGHDIGLAISNPGAAQISVTMTAYQIDGNTVFGSATPLLLDPQCHTAAFVSQKISGLPAGFKGVLDIVSEPRNLLTPAGPFVALTLRSLVNTRKPEGDFLLTTLPIADISKPAPTPIVFPHIADGEGYTTQFIMIGTTGDSSMTFSLLGDEGDLLKTPMSFTRVTGPNGIQFMTVPSGSFLMGSTDPDTPTYDHSGERPVHNVAISQFFELGVFEVTQGQWLALMGSNPSHFIGSSDLPVETVSWNDVQALITKLNLVNDGYQYGLPTEAQWEYVCRAGTTGNPANLSEIAWYADNSGDQTHVVGTKKPNDWGIYDMIGNVKEWVQDWYNTTYYSVSPSVDPPGAPVSSVTPPARVNRGGSYGNHSPGSASPSARNATTMDVWQGAQILGLRLMRRLVSF